LSVLEEQYDRLTPLEQTLVRDQQSIRERDYVGRMTALRYALQLAPRLQVIRFRLSAAALALNRPVEAIEALKPITDSVIPSHYYFASWPLSRMTDLQHMVGDYEQELQYANLGRERFPDVAAFFTAKARALAAMGKTDAVYQVIEEFRSAQIRGRATLGGFAVQAAIELRAHGQRKESVAMAARALEWFDGHRSLAANRPDLQVQRALALTLTDRPSEARDLLLQLGESVPNGPAIGRQGTLGIYAAFLGDHDEALRISDSLPTGDDPRAIADRKYWRACIAAHLGEEKRAVELLSESFSEGYPYGVELHSALGLEPLWDYPPFQELIRPNG
jgi:tetratricopeptide (TPR) repeat protein